MKMNEIQQVICLVGINVTCHTKLFSPVTHQDQGGSHLIQLHLENCWHVCECSYRVMCWWRKWYKKS